MDSTHGMPSRKVALAYKEAVESQRSGEVLDVRDHIRSNLIIDLDVYI